MNRADFHHSGTESADSAIAASMYQVGIFGTFDVENYGDLLFPLIAQRQLEKRISKVTIVPFSPNHMSKNASWPMDVNALDSMPDLLASLSALLIGGGQIFRFDKGYPIPVPPEIYLPADYWISPAVLGTLLGKPVIWNAIGAWTGSPIPSWYVDALKAVFSASTLVTVRDEVTRIHLLEVAPATEIQVIPDTAFSLARLWPLEHPSSEYLAWKKASKVEGSYIVVQADRFILNHQDAINQILRELSAETVVILPVCRCHGDRSELFQPYACGHSVFAEWLSPILICEVIANASLVIASSLHACITSICYGVPCIRIESFNSYDKKYEMLNGFEAVCGLEERERIRYLFSRGRFVEPLAIEYAERLECYWLNVARIIVNWNTADSMQVVSIMQRWIIKVLHEMEASGQREQNLMQSQISSKHRFRWNPFSR